MSRNINFLLSNLSIPWSAKLKIPKGLKFLTLALAKSI